MYQSTSAMPAAFELQNASSALNVSISGMIGKNRATSSEHASTKTNEGPNRKRDSSMDAIQIKETDI